MDKISEHDGGYNTMYKYWNELKKKRERGLSEGQAVMEWLQEHENKRGNKKKDK